MLFAITSVSWASTGAAGTAALGPQMLRADAAGSPGPVTAAVADLGAEGSVPPSGDVPVFGPEGAKASTAIEIAPPGADRGRVRQADRGRARHSVPDTVGAP